MAVVARKRVSSAGTGNLREQVSLTGVLDGTNRVFTLPDTAIHEPPGSRVKVYHGTRRLQDSEYVVEESGGTGTGFDTVRLTAFAPKVTSRLFADYIAV